MSLCCWAKSEQKRWSAISKIDQLCQKLLATHFSAPSLCIFYGLLRWKWHAAPFTPAAAHILCKNLFTTEKVVILFNTPDAPETRIDNILQNFVPKYKKIDFYISLDFTVRKLLVIITWYIPPCLQTQMKARPGENLTNSSDPPILGVIFFKRPLPGKLSRLEPQWECAGTARCFPGNDLKHFWSGFYNWLSDIRWGFCFSKHS